MPQETLEITRIDFHKWQEVITAITGFDDPVYWKSLLENPDFDKKGLFKASIRTKEKVVTAGAICSHSIPSGAVIDNLFLHRKELSNIRVKPDRVANELILSAINRLKELGNDKITTRISYGDPNRVYFERNGFVALHERIHMTKVIEKQVKLLNKGTEKFPASHDILKLTSEQQLGEFAELNQIIFKEDNDSDPLTENEIREWLVKDPSFGLDQMFFAVDTGSGKKIGVGHCFYYPAEQRGGIFGIGVLEEYRGQGVASMLIKAIIDCIRGKGGKNTYIECYKGSEAEKIYKHLGFTQINAYTIMRWEK